MKDATEHILRELSVRGYRITKQRTAVVAALARQHQPQSIRTLCMRSKNTDETSVYRTVRTLVEENFVEEITLQGEVPHYALAESHHHHAVCTVCKEVKHIACNSHHADIPDSFASIESHEVTLYGLCKKCA